MKSTDGGSVWTVSEEGYYDENGDVVSDPNNDAIFWAGGSHNNGSAYVMAVSKTTDIGETWTHYELTNTTGMTYVIAVDPSNSDITYAGGYAGRNPALYRTTDRGESWSDIAAGLSGSVFDLALHPDSSNIIYAGTYDGVFKSTESGGSWTNTGCSNVSVLLIDPHNPTTIYAGTMNSGVYRSTSGGGDWQAMNDGLDTTAITCLGIDPGLYLFAGTYGAGLYRQQLNMGIEHDVLPSSRHHILNVRPNPMQSKTEICFALSTKAPVEILIYDAQGRLVKSLVNEIKEAGLHTARWHATDERGTHVSTGVYFCKLTAGESESIEKIIVVR